jgi:2-succinyl-5-enolpyruvyl-6-hydroxy-3-cyclohexene-1-carboxylate synthase
MGPVQLTVELTPPLVGAPAPLPPRRPFHCPDRPPEGVVTVAGGLSNRAAIVTVAGASSNRFEAPAPAAAGESASRAETFSPEVDRSRAGRGAAARGVVVAGDMPPARGRLWAQAAARAGWPLLAEPSSNARWGPAAIRFYNMLLPRLGADIEQVVVVGHPTLSRPVAGLLARRDVELMVLAEGGDWIDPGWAVTTVATDVALPLADPAWLARWHALDAVAALSPNVPGETVGVTVTGGAGLSPAAGETVGATPLTGATVLPVAGEAGETALPGAAGLSPDTAGGAVGAAPLTGAALAAAVWAALGPGDNLMLGPSQIVRQAEQAPISPDPPAVYANRGLAGIDGVIATALGLAAATDRPTTVLLGDLTAVHDLGSLVIPARERPIGLRLVIADDNGGSIFAGLEPGQAQGPAAEALERCFTVPPGVDLAAVAVSLGASAVKVATVAELAAALARPWSGRHVIVAALAD